MAATRLAWMLRLCVAATFLLIVTPGADASAAKFESWFPLLSQKTYQNVSEGACNVTLHEYRQTLMGTDSNMKAATCSWQQSCILSQLREDLKSRMASASVLLGLTPSLLASIGPSVVETAVLSTQNPLLSLLISLGCPAVFPSRVLAYEDARDTLRVPAFQPLSGLYTGSVIASLAVRTTKYLTLCAAAINVFYTSWQLGTKTVVSFRCVDHSLVIWWTSLSVIIHLFAASAFYTRTRHFLFAHTSQSRYRLTNVDQPVSDGPAQPSLTYRESDLEDRVRPTNRSIISNYVSTFLGYLHVVFGTMVFSSLLFIETVDVVAVILRYMASTVVARVILMYELDHLRRCQQRTPRGIAQTVELQSAIPVKMNETAYSHASI